MGDSSGQRAKETGNGQQEWANRDKGQRRAMAMGSGDGQEQQLWAKQWVVATAVGMVTAMGGILHYRNAILTLRVHNKAIF